jgi:guanylate kinase
MTECANSGFLIIISGPAGSGKTTLCDQMLARHSPKIERVITATTRQPRVGEVNGVDYWFLSEAEFEERIEAQGFLEYAKVHGRYYGVPVREVSDRLNKGVHLLLNIDVQGAATLRANLRTGTKVGGRMISVFIKPASIEQIRERLTGRNTDATDEIERRLQTAMSEMNEVDQFDYCILSGSREADLSRLQAIYCAEKCRVVRS